MKTHIHCLLVLFASLSHQTFGSSIIETITETPGLKIMKAGDCTVRIEVDEFGHVTIHVNPGKDPVSVTCQTSQLETIRKSLLARIGSEGDSKVNGALREALYQVNSRLYQQTARRLESEEGSNAARETPPEEG